MSGDDRRPPNAGEPRGGGEERTVFMPSGGDQTPPPPPPPVAAPPGQWSPPGASEPPQHTGHFQTSFAPRADGQGIQVGDILNHIFEVKRFIARGGMGEVFEGANVNSEERVAIKVMLPSLAADPNVIGMFRKEARTLTRLNHEALVSYRVLAQEPQLGVLYIVTEYIDGRNLADALGEIRPTAAALIQLLRRLASGLRAAHMLGAIHRDMSPDNVILENGELSRAKVIDFGIAKDLDAGSATIVGEGFAGKLNYVAPEQLGDFGREIGPWTDVYSLALVLLAVATGRNVAMGGSLVDAVDKRRAGPDLSAAPEELKPVLAKMLAPNPQDRLRSMDAVLAELEDRAPEPAARGGRGPLIAGAGLSVLVLVAAGWFALGRSHAPATPAGGSGSIMAVANDPDSVARAAIDSALPSVACTWLNVMDVKAAGKRVAVSMRGVAGNPAAAQSDIFRALAAQRLTDPSLNFEDVAPILPAGCSALDAFRQIRTTNDTRLSVPQRKFEMRMQSATAIYPNQLAANSLVTLNIGDATTDFALLGIEPDGKIYDLVESRAAFDAIRKQSPTQVSDLGGDRYQFHIDLDHQGWSGYLLVTGKGPFDKALVAPDVGARGPDWRDRFLSTAAANGWQADMVWFKSVDEVKE